MTQNTDLLYAFTGISSAQMVTALSTLLTKRERFQTELIEQLTQHPPESLLGFTISASAAFYLAEREVNPQINTLVDALYYISTCLTVGYADVFPATQKGRLIASLVMTLGPALTNNALDPPGREKPASARNQQAVLDRLDAIVGRLAGENSRRTLG